MEEVIIILISIVGALFMPVIYVTAISLFLLLVQIIKLIAEQFYELVLRTIILFIVKPFINVDRFKRFELYISLEEIKKREQAKIDYKKEIKPDVEYKNSHFY